MLGSTIQISFSGCIRLYTRLITVIIFGGVLKSMLTLNEAIIDVKEG
jgi:hypothetical protein